MQPSENDIATTVAERLASLKVPQHVAIIMDGNGRWAKKKGKIRTFGHRAGVESVRAAVRFARQSNIQVLTLFAFSSENWKRPEEEVSVLMDLFNLVLNKEAKRLNKNGVRLQVLGDLSRFDDKLVSKIRKAEEMTSENTDLVLNIAANYGGRWDILHAAKQMAQDIAAGNVAVDNIDETGFDQYMSTQGLPELDLLIRTGGEHRISNFLLWQCAYAELYFTDVLWPDFDEEAFYLAVKDFSERQRRFGLIGEQVEAEEVEG
ncbi:undecaprenyl diphosphate synthase [Marisediminitalea aggregata]|jgi:undecaprenyl diphosphate synthase|uniref:Ditrans,polycis-undecaprenyl-diphosphate synthase ((2E,6E)-farnesyl-diphosphate specific) n=4 Tax=Alteromonadaceae TaxID=72275 RepID=A0A1M5GUH8_9ALTE|nr:polyprenyl diphosphate synthase [Marisediminitalea aggregata]MAP23438.1 di-trans,poly-cis-decaprenylcistransferase [Alteromonadaceae bacterium]MCP4234029.1 di-trans,poly-cis-decaprenylcistransferase [Aestuariibacter sp.]MEC7471334.1 polyprenyl diphosphate synthase [Pseudomonadota bacterium]HBY41739.1 di-trans,poly-cis-decaprenylcistransferase [Alteromonas sp.]MAX43469.1 di-trans,poly-cis-decaprenylcistransferase [Alteromonadaceae bacterium]|tara:strand:+ start:21028 stop:21813 length:786 start_codon:yes stop_codon:yes gene_type:complete